MCAKVRSRIATAENNGFVSWARCTKIVVLLVEGNEVNQHVSIVCPSNRLPQTCRVYDKHWSSPGCLWWPQQHLLKTLCVGFPFDLSPKCISNCTIRWAVTNPYGKCFSYTLQCCLCFSYCSHGDNWTHSCRITPPMICVEGARCTHRCQNDYHAIKYLPE